MSIRLKSLSLSGFRSFVDEATITFDATGLILITGSSGWGKSTLCLAVSYALGFCPYPSTELASWGNDALIKVELVLDTPEGELRIRRAPTLTVWVDGVQAKGGTKLVEERIQQLIGLSPEMLALLTYRGQRQPGLFLSKTDAEKKEFLTRLLGLDRFEVSIEQSMTAVRELEKDVAIAEADRNRVLQFLHLSQSKESLAVVESEITQALATKEVRSARADTLRAKIAVLETQRQSDGAAAFAQFDPQIKAARQALADIGPFIPPPVQDSDTLIQSRSLVEQVQLRLQRLEEEDASAHKASRTKWLELSAIAGSLKGEVAQKDVLVAQRARLKADLASLNESLCPTCERPWDSTKVKVAEVSKVLRGTEQLLAAMLLCEQELTTVLAEIEALPKCQANPNIPKFQATLLVHQQAVAEESGRLQGFVSVAKAEHRQHCSEATTLIHSIVAQQFAAITEAESAIGVQIESIAAEVIIADAAARAAGLLLDTASLRAEKIKVRLQLEQQFAETLAQTDATLMDLSGRLAAEKDFLLLIGREGFLGSIFDEVLAEIADEANRILGTVANTRHCTIAFRTEGLTQKGVVKKSIVPVMNISGQEAPIASGLSGGMLSTVELAVDLALGTVVSRRSGVSPGWLILDESFEGLNSNSKESCMEILGAYARDRLVIVIDHATEFQGLFTKEIAVNYNQGRSTLAL